MAPHHSPKSTIRSYQFAETFTHERFSPIRTRDFACEHARLSASPLEDITTSSPLTLPSPAHLPRLAYIDLPRPRPKIAVANSIRSDTSLSSSQDGSKSMCVFNLESCEGENFALHPVCDDCFERQMIRRQRLMWRWPAALGGILFYTALIVTVMWVAFEVKRSSD
jgi:hypothetical protein